MTHQLPEPREYNRVPSFLRWQVRVRKTRPARYPLYNGKDEIIGYGGAEEYKAQNPQDIEPIPATVDYWELLGYGETWGAAAKMAKKYA